MVENEKKEEPTNQQILNINFNQDGTCFAIGTQKGFRIYNTSPFKENIERRTYHFTLELEGGIGIVEMLYKTNIIALVGGGSNPKYTLNKVILWDDNQMKAITELRVTSYIRNVKLKKDKYYCNKNRIFVVCEQKIYVLKFVNLQNIDTIETYNNVKGNISSINEESLLFLRILKLQLSPIQIRLRDMLRLKVTVVYS